MTIAAMILAFIAIVLTFGRLAKAQQASAEKPDRNNKQTQKTK